MVHRIDRIIPDLDDFLTPPNAGRSSLNMRFAASVNNTNLGNTLVNGMSELEYAIPDGDNQVIGAKEDFESQAVFFALWNSNDDHGIYRILGNTIDLVIGGAILNFQEDSDVSIAIIDGKIYWTDNVNQPRMCNIAKGIAGDYPDPLEEWMITQIKRPPGLPLAVERYNGATFVSVDIWSKTEASDDYSNSGNGIFNNNIPFEFAYYYIYDNYEESVLSPYSIECYYTKDIRLVIPTEERNAYLGGYGLVTRIVWLYRQGNTGVWYVAATGDKDRYIVNIDDLLLMPKITVSADIIDRLYDSVPIKAVSNEVAQNRINLGNYLSDYDTVETLTLTATAVAAPYNSNANAQVINKIHKPGATYNVGVELLDEWGRRIGVVNQVEVTIPTYENFALASQENDPFVPTNQYQDWQDNSYWIEWELTGTVPSWAKYFRIVESAAQNVVNFYRFTSSMLYWYKGDDGLDYLSRIYMGAQYRQKDALGPFNTALDFYHQGYALYLPTGVPIQFVEGDQTYVVIIGSYGFLGENPKFDYGTYGDGQAYKVEKQVDSALYFKLKNDILDPAYLPEEGLADSLFLSPAYFSVEVTVKTKSASELYYQNENVFEITGDISETGNLYGDCYLTQYNTIYNPWFTSFIYDFNVSGDGYVDYDTNPDSSFPFRGGMTNGVVAAMNPTSVYNQNWNPQQGQESIVNEMQQQVRILQGIIFSNPLIQGTQINGLSKFNSVDNRQAPLENGPITALVRTNAKQGAPGVLLAIGSNGVSSFYYNAAALTNTDGTGNVTATTEYLATQNPLQGNYGADRLRDICVTPLGTVYYWSQGIRDWIRYTNAGLEQLGETYQFMNYMRNRLDTSTSVMVTYDQVTDEAIIIGNDANAMVFSERFKTFQGEREYKQEGTDICPERGATLSTRTFFFLQGHVWQMGPGIEPAASENSFFGTIRNPELQIVDNEAPTIVKQWNSVKVMGPKPSVLDMTSGSQESPVIQSYIASGWWINRKGDWDAAIRKDENSVGGVLNGKPMESRILILSFAWDATTFVKLNFIDVKHNTAIVQ